MIRRFTITAILAAVIGISLTGCHTHITFHGSPAVAQHVTAHA